MHGASRPDHSTQFLSFGSALISYKIFAKREKIKLNFEFFMIPYFVFDHIVIGPIKLYTWGLFVGLAFSAGYLFVLYRAKAKNIEISKIIGLTLAIFFGAAVGSRLLFLLQAPKEFLADVSLLWRINQGGLMLWGGILGAILFGWLYIKYSHGRIRIAEAQGAEARFSHANFWQMADLATPAIALGIAIGRIGCFLINDHQGSPTNLPWGILWPDGISRHPVALYELLAAFALFVIFWWWQRKTNSCPPSSVEEGAGGGVEISNHHPTSILPLDGRAQRALASAERRSQGKQFLIFLICYALIRFFLDFLRALQGILADPRWLGLTTSQWVSLILFIAAIYFYLRKNRRFFATKKAAEKTTL